MTKLSPVIRGLLTVLIVFTGIAAAAAQNPAAAPHVKIRLLPERGAIQPGEEIWIGVEQSIDPGWHTYWQNPGDSGTAPIITWTLPEGFAIGPVQWPVPQKIPYDVLLNYGYENHVILLQKLTAPAALPDGPLTLAAQVEILVCKDICIPESGRYSLTLNGDEAMAEDNAAFLAAAQRQLPVETGITGSFTERDGQFLLSFPADGTYILESYDIKNVAFLPADWGLIDNPAPVTAAFADGRLTLTQRRGDRPLDDVQSLSGVLILEQNGAVKALAVAATATGAPPPVQHGTAVTSLAQVLIFALLGGMILNLMPCVFPVLSIKALSLVKLSEKERGLAALHGVSYTAGVMLSFLLVAVTLMILKTAGAEIGWGFQLQNPMIVTLLAYLLFVIGLNLAGFFDIEIDGGLANIGAGLTQGQGLIHSFFTGVLATIVATPCTAPFMAAALGYALTQPAAISLIVFAALGFGLALPYLLLSLLPALQKRLPRPGAWMEVFKQFLAFPMFASAAWLVWVLSQQAGPMGVLGALMGLVFIAFALWLLQHTPAQGLKRWLVQGLALLAALLALCMLPAGSMDKAADVRMQSMETQSYSAAALADALENTADPVFVEMTAAWCITCKINHAVAIAVNATQRLFAENKVRYMVGDWTSQDPHITKYLAQFDRSGVPLYVYYGPKDGAGKRPDPVVLPQILTPQIVADLFQP